MQEIASQKKYYKIYWKKTAISECIYVDASNSPLIWATFWTEHGPKN